MAARVNRPSRLPALALLLVAFALLAGLYSVIVPPYEAPDEIWHMAFVYHLVTERGLPVSEPETTALWRQQGTQPPAYYLVAALLTAWIDQSDFPALYGETHPYAAIGGGPDPIKHTYFLHGPGEEYPWHGAVLALHVTRFFSISLGMVTLWATYQAVRTLADGERGERTALLATALLAFIPQFVFISAMANNDNAINALAALLLWRLVKILAAGGNGRQSIATSADMVVVAVIVALGVLSKASGLWMVALSLGVIAVVAYRRAGWRWGLCSATLLLGVVSLISGWWFLRNYQLYGDPFASNIWFSNILLRNRPATLRTLVFSEWESLDHSFWGLFGWFNVAYPIWLYRTFQVLEVAILVGLGLWLWRARRAGELGQAPFGRKAATLLLVTWLICLVISWAAFFRVAPAAQGRYFFPAAPTLALGMALGLGAWRRYPDGPRGVAWSVAGGLLALTLITPFWLLRPAYAASPVLSALPATAAPLDVTFGDAMHLIGYEVTPATVSPSHPVDVTLYWRSLRPMSENYSISIKGFGRALRHATVAEDNSYPDAGRWATSDWPAEGIIVDRWRIWLSGESVTPTLARLSVETFILDKASGVPGGPLPITVARAPVSSPYHFADVVVREAAAPEPASGYSFRPIDAVATVTESVATLDFTWEVGDVVPQSYQMFAHLVGDPSEPPLANGDAPPAGGHFPTTYWHSGDRIAEQATIPLPSNLPDGEYSVVVGLYDLVSGQRIAGDGERSEWRLATLRWDGARWTVVAP